ncbi:MAG: SDR family oxidoreductase [Myxococcales bacterium]|nr:SDR family oxidoreductase [Myxococcales bacterium]
MATALVTGANRGIGLALAALLKQRGDRVIATCRSRSAALDALGVEVVEGIDVADAQGVASLAAAVGSRRLDLLVNNAGILVWGDTFESPNYEALDRQFQVNAVGPLRVTSALRENLQRGAKVALVTSRMGSIGDNTSGGAYGYRMSKAALNMAGKSMAEDLKGAGVAVIVLHPGMVKTDMVGDHGQIEPAEAARGLLARIDELTIETTGHFWHANGQALPW